MQEISASYGALTGYGHVDGFFDEAFDENGNPRPHYAAIIDQLAGLDLGALRAAAQADVDRRGVAFTTATGTQPFVVDPIPRVIPSDEWRKISTGVAQRVRALNAFVLDVYDEQRIVSAGIIPIEAIEGAEYYEPDLVGTAPPAGVFTNIAGLDLVRDLDGELRVLEDNVRSPSGLTFSLAARQMSDTIVPFTGGRQKLPVDDNVFKAISDALHAAAPEGASGEPAIALVSDGPESAAWYEHRRVADALDIYLFSLDQIENQGGAIYGRSDDGLLKPIDVIYRRTDLDRLRLPSGALSHFGELMLGPIRENTVACVNAFGSGIADDKLIHAYVEDMIVFYLSEEPILESVTTYDPSNAETRAMVDERINELVVKPRGGLGGKGVLIGRNASVEQLEAARRDLELSPQDWVVQETVALSTHPTVIGDSLEPRHIDLRPYAIHLGEDARTLPACLTRVALERGELIVNSSQNGERKTHGLQPSRNISGTEGMNSAPRPVIGVSSSEIRVPEHLKQIPKGEPPHREICLGIPYLNSVQQVGAVPLIIPPMQRDTIESILETVDAICLSGGPDLDPSTYGQAPHEKLGPTELATDAFEIALAKAADRRGMPILAICRGMQVLNVARGGTLYQHIPDVYGEEALSHRQTELGHHPSHEVTIEPGTLLERTIGGATAEVNSFHHQSVEKLGSGLRLSARSPEGIIEGVEAVDRDFVVGVQWHAESLTNRDEHEALFRGLVEAAGRYRTAAQTRRIQAV